MLRDFRSFARLIAAQFAFLSTHELFRVDVEGDFLWQIYLDSFPPGTNPIYRVRTEHDGSYDRNFIRRFGNVVAIVNGKIQTIWDIQTDDEAYREVCATMAAFVRDGSIVSVFREWEQKLGRVSSTEKLDSGHVHTWHHFHAEVAKKHLVPRGKVGEVVGDLTTKLSVFTRGIIELESTAVSTVLDLIQQGTLYRGAEFKDRLQKFSNLMAQHDALPVAPARDREIWLAHTFATQPWDVTLIRNSVIGTLLVDLSEGKDLEAAVKAYEQKVAPANYKRPTALVTQRMIDDATETVEELGLSQALARRHATLRDVSVNNVLWASRGAQLNMKEGLGALITPTAPTGKHAADKAIDITIDEFVEKILPDTTGIEVLLSNRLRGNLVSITTAAEADAPSLFKWGSQFAWSYNGNIADSDMRAAVQAAGGRVDGAFRFTHSWNHEGRRNTSLMDLHVFLPAHGGHRGQGQYRNYGNTERVGWNHRKHPASGGVQDVDYTPAAPVGYIPVENITFPDINKMPEGVYRCAIHNWSFRPGTTAGFKAEIEFGGQVFEYDYPKVVKANEWVEVAEITLKGGVFSIKHLLPHGASSVEAWGLQTEQYVRVDTLMLSPNHWDGIAVGNKHWFFLINGCRNDEPTRGIYNEFLLPALEKHRKVFELLGNKTKVAPADEQLSGLGFSSTVRNFVTVRLEHKRGRPLYNIHF